MIENKRKAYGDYGKMKDTIGDLTEVVDNWFKQVSDGGELLYDDIFFLNMIFMKLLRAIKSNHYDSFLDLANYARLECIERTGKDILDDLIKFRNMERMSNDSSGS